MGFTVSARRFYAPPDETRYLWAPELHAAYAERCYFFLVAGRDTERRSTFTDQLEHLLDEIDIESRLVHVLFGQYDALIRMWATEGARQRFLRELKAHPNLHIDSLVEFAADATSYRFGSQGPHHDDLRLTEHDRNLVQAVVTAEHEGLWDIDSPIATAARTAFDLLVKRKLLFEVPPVAGVKLYMVFHSGGFSIAQPRDLIVGALAADAEAAGLRQVTLYSGVGFAHFIMKGWIDRFDDLLAAVNAVRRTAKDLQLNPWTLVVADGWKISGETIDAVQVQLPAALQEFVEDAEVLPADTQRELRRELNSLSTRDRDVITLAYHEAKEVLSGTECPRYVEIVTASLVKDRALFTRSLSYLTSIEEDLRAVLPKALQAHLGPSWLRDVESRGWLKPSSGEPDLNEELGQEDRINLAALLLLLRRGCDEYDDIREAVAGLPRDWYKHIRLLVRLRNRFVHGNYGSTHGRASSLGSGGNTS